MARKRRIVTPLPTIGHVPDELWERIEPVRNELDPPAKTGRRRIEEVVPLAVGIRLAAG